MSKIRISTAVGVVLLGVLVSLSFVVKPADGDAHATAINLGILVLGVTVGWLLGTVVSPYDREEKSEFSRYSKAFGVFLSGYVVGKVDKLIEHVLTPGYALEPLHGFRILAFVAATIIAFLVTFIWRRYG